MATNPEVLLYTLQSFGQEDLKTFQWHLINGVEGFTSIQKALLEKADRHDTVDQMVQRYGHSRVVEITLAILKKMNQNQLAEELTTKLKDGGERSEEITGKSTTAASSTAAQPGDSVRPLTAGKLSSSPLSPLQVHVSEKQFQIKHHGLHNVCPKIRSQTLYLRLFYSLRIRKKAIS
ncbi:hypothetical protein MHYP_G00092690 [Metynnis hypsauchen]